MMAILSNVIDIILTFHFYYKKPSPEGRLAKVFIFMQNQYRWRSLTTGMHKGVTPKSRVDQVLLRSISLCGTTCTLTGAGLEPS